MNIIATKTYELIQLLENIEDVKERESTANEIKDCIDLIIFKTYKKEGDSYENKNKKESKWRY